MARQCDTRKYRRRKRRERLNAIARVQRIEVLEAQRRAQVQERLRKAELARLADPRRQLVQRLINVLYVRLSSSPLDQITKIASLFGVDGKRILDAMVRGDDSVPLPPGYV